MRIIAFLALFVVVIVTGFSCDNAAGLTGGSDHAEDSVNLVAAGKIWQAYEDGDVSNLDSVVSTSFVNHTDLGDKRGIDSLKLTIKWLHDNITDLRIDKEREWADGEYVGQWVHYSGTNTGGGSNFPLGEFMVRGIVLTKFYNAKAVERWFFYDGQTMTDLLSRLQQQRNNVAVPDSTAAAADSLNKADSTKKK